MENKEEQRDSRERANVRKSTVSRAAAGQTKSTASRTAADQAKSTVSRTAAGQAKSTASRASTSQAKKSVSAARTVNDNRKRDGVRPGDANRRSTGSRQQSGRHMAADSRPRSATEQAVGRTSTGRPVDRSRTAGSSGPVSRGTAAKRNASHKKSKQRRVQRKISTRQMVVASIVVGLVLAFVITLIMRANMLRVKQIATDFNIGDVFDITNYIEADSNDARLVYDADDFKPDKLGKYKIKYKVVRGRMSATKTASLNIVDEVTPYIDGPDEIDVAVGSEINWSDYYTVTDDDPDIQNKLKSSIDIDTQTARAVTTTLSVTDWAGNQSSKKITVNIMKDNFSDK